MSLIQMQIDLESFSDDMLQSEVQQPSGQYPAFLVATEIQRRADFRKRFQAQTQGAQAAAAPPIIEQRMAEMNNSQPPMAGSNQMPSPMAQGIGGVQQFQDGGPVRDPDPTRKLTALQRARLQRGLDPYASSGLDALFSHQGPGYANEWLMRQGVSPALVSRWAGETSPTDPSAPWAHSSGSLYTHEIVRPQVASQTGDFEVDPPDRTNVGVSHRRPTIDRGIINDALAMLDPARESNEAAYDAAMSANEQVRLAQEEYAEMLANNAERGTSETERMLTAQKRSPKDLSEERRTMALAQLGALIGGAVNPGDIAGDLGEANMALMGLKDQQRIEQRDLDLALAKARDERTNANSDRLIQAHGAKVAGLADAASRATDAMKAYVNGQTSITDAYAKVVSAAAQFESVSATVQADESMLRAAVQLHGQILQLQSGGIMGGRDQHLQNLRLGLEKWIGERINMQLPTIVGPEGEAIGLGTELGFEGGGT